MTDPRIDPDFDPTDELVLRVAKIMRHTPFVYNEARVEGNGIFNKWLLMIVAGLIVVGVPALIASVFLLSERIGVVETKMDIVLMNWQTVKPK